jgi:hypothetical protein
MSSRFDPRPHLRTLDDGTPYLDVKWRLHWLRSEHPDAQVETQLIPTEDDSVVCKATVKLPAGGSASGHASATRAPNQSHIEQAETRAIGRALAALGYGAEFAEDDLLQTRPTLERPVTLVPSQPRPERTERTERTERSERPEPAEHERADEPASLQPPARVRPVRPEPSDGENLPPGGTRRELRETTTEPQPDTAPAAPTPLTRASDLRQRGDTAPAHTAESEDVSWTHFWKWARRRGYKDANHLRELLGIEVNALTPGEVRDHIKRYEMDHPAPGSDE